MNEQHWLERHVEAVICFDFGKDVLLRIFDDYGDPALITFVKMRHAKRLYDKAQAWAFAERAALERVGRNLNDWDETEYKVALANITTPHAFEMVLSVTPAYLGERGNASKIVWVISLGELLAQPELEASAFIRLHMLRTGLLINL